MENGIFSTKKKKKMENSTLIRIWFSANSSISSSMSGLNGEKFICIRYFSNFEFKKMLQKFVLKSSTLEEMKE